MRGPEKVCYVLVVAALQERDELVPGIELMRPVGRLAQFLAQ